MNTVTPITPDALRSLTTQQPAMLAPGMRAPEAALHRFTNLTREQLRAYGVEVAACDPARKLKGWVDPDAKLGEVARYSVLTPAGVEMIEMPGEEARTWNLAGVPRWPVPDRTKIPSGVTFETADRSGVIPPEQLATEEEAAEMLEDVGDAFEIVSAVVASGGRTRIVAAESEKRRPWVLRHKERPTQNYAVGLNIQEQVVKRAKGAPGRWSVSDVDGLRYTPDRVAETSTLGMWRVPVGPLPTGAVVESAGPIGDALQVYVPGATAPVDSEVILQQILAEIREVKAIVGSGQAVPWL